jgi:hypothetical protein
MEVGAQADLARTHLCDEGAARSMCADMCNYRECLSRVELLSCIALSRVLRSPRTGPTRSSFSGGWRSWLLQSKSEALLMFGAPPLILWYFVAVSRPLSQLYRPPHYHALRRAQVAIVAALPIHDRGDGLAYGWRLLGCTAQKDIEDLLWPEWQPDRP